MRFLLDSHAWLWLTSQPEKLRGETLTQLSQADAVIYFSVASAWEIGIKFSMGKLELPQAPDLFIPSRLSRDRITSLPIELSHILRAAGLPLIHKDPFDRLLVAQAQCNGLHLVTRDAWVQQYEVDWIVA